MSKFKYLKKFITKITVTALAALMVMSMAGGVMAKSFTDIGADHEYKEQIDILSDIGVIVGTSDTEFSPNERVTREQMAMLLFRLMLGRGNSGTINATDFTDLYDETYHGAISWANASGYIIGTSETTFEPIGGITLQDAMTMVVRALGQSSASMDKGYPWTYIDAAIKLGLDNGLEKIGYEDTLTRAQTAAILYNALTAEYLIPKTASNGNTYLEKTTIIEYVFGYKIEDAILTATNTYSIDDKSIVVKDGYVTFTLKDTSNMTVKFSELGLNGTANDWLGKGLKIIFKVDPQTKLISVLGSSYNGKSEKFDKVTVASDNSFITVNDVKYNVVLKLSDSLGTNANELLVYAFDNSGKLVQVKSNELMKAYLGFYSIEMIYNNSGSSIANRAIIKNYKFDKLNITDGKINVAGGLTTAELTGGFLNPSNAGHGNYVLYYFNSGNKSLEIAKVIAPSLSLLVSKLTETTATVGGVEYKLGNIAAGIAPVDVKNQLIVGSYASVVIVDNMILAVSNANITTAASKYLVTTTNALPVYTNGKLQYIVTANIDGKLTDIIVENSSIAADMVYRYTVDANNIYTLIANGSPSFVQNTEFPQFLTFNSDTTITKGSNPYFTLDTVNFVTDSSTVIVVKNGNSFEYKKGFYASTIQVNAGAQLTAIYSNNPGNIETLSYLYISSGSMGTVDSSTQYVKVLSATGSEFVNGKVYTVYEVLNYNTGSRETRLSLSTLTTNTSYALDSNGYIVNVAPITYIKGLVSGYTGTTITVGGNVYRLSTTAKILKIKADLTTTSTTLANVYLTEVEFVVNGNEINTIIAGTALSFAPSFDKTSKVITITPSVNLTGITENDVKLVSVMRGTETLKVEEWKLDVNPEKMNFTIQLYSIQAGTYTFTFSVNNVQYVVSLDLPDIISEAEGTAE